MRDRTLRSSLSLATPAVVILAVMGAAFAGGPNNLDYQGGFLRWNTTVSVPFTIDNGPLRSGITRDTGAAIVREQMAKWTDVPTASILLHDNGFLNIDVDATNYRSFFGFDSPQGPFVRAENPVIFDADGKITDDFLGSGSSNQTLGFAGIRSVQGDEFLSGWAVLNGRQASATSVTFRQTVLHELGHFIGLDHSQGLIENWNNPGADHLGDVPVMFPYGSEPDLPSKPITDDIAWLSWMYPVAGWAESTGTIKGQVFRLRMDGPPLQGANVAAIPAISDGKGGFLEARSNIVTCVSDFLAEGTGEFELPGLAPGYYFVRIDRISTSFTGGSGIGPFDDRPESFAPDYYDDQESATDDNSRKVAIHVGAGETVTGINMVANEPLVLFTKLTVGAPAIHLSAMGDDDTKMVLFPDSFGFPFYGRIYREVYVNSDGNLTFGVGDAIPGAPRTEDRFLSGPPRIAPLFTDLDPTTAYVYGGSVDADAGVGYVRIRWIAVPEYLEVGVGDPNTFSVVLYSTGEISFEYGNISVTPDQDDVYGTLQAIAGVSPGHVYIGSSTDLSGAVQYDMSGAPVYQVFPDTAPTNAFDLSGRSIRFLADLTDLYFPFIQGDSQLFTGIAISNYGSTTAAVAAEFRGADGDLQGYPLNPTQFEIAPDAQYAALGREMFDIPAGESHSGWARLVSTDPEIGSFFQFGNGLVGPLTKMDGSTAWTTQSQKLYFTRIYQGQAVYPSYSGLKDATTWLSIVNPNEQDITVTMQLFSPQGAQIGTNVVRPIAAQGRIFDTVASIFNRDGDPFYDGYVKVVVDGPGAIGFEMIELADSLFGLNAATDTAAQVLYSAQLGHGSTIYTSLKLVNPTSTVATVTVRAFIREAGGTIGERVFGPFQLGPNQALQQTAAAMFGLGPGGTDLVEGSMRVNVEGAGAFVVGDVVFGDPQSARFAAALPLQSRLFRKAVQGQISNGRVPGNPSLDSFTGLALFNPNTTSAHVTVEVFDKDGNSVGSKELTLKANERISKLLYETDFVPESLGLIRGYVVLTADQPIVAQQLFGNLALDYLSAVVPTIVE